MPKTNAVTATRAVCYIRVSLEKMAEHGGSLDAQRAKLEQYAALYDLAIVECIVDTQSAKNLDRPGLQRALGMLRTGEADALLVIKLDRLTRSVRDLGTLIETYFASGKAALLSVSEQVDTRSAGGRLVLNVLASVSQWEREAIGERTSAVMQNMKARGEFTGGRVPYGARLAEDGTLQSDDDEQEVIRFACHLREEGMSLRAISESLAAGGAFARNGKPFADMQISRMITNAAPVALAA